MPCFVVDNVILFFVAHGYRTRIYYRLRFKAARKNKNVVDIYATMLVRCWANVKPSQHRVNTGSMSDIISDQNRQVTFYSALAHCWINAESPSALI